MPTPEELGAVGKELGTEILGPPGIPAGIRPSTDTAPAAVPRRCGRSIRFGSDLVVANVELTT